MDIGYKIVATDKKNGVLALHGTEDQARWATETLAGTDYLKLKLTPSGKYKAEDIDSVDDSLCDIKKTINNKKVKSYVELNGKLPDGVESTGYVLRKTLKGGE